MLKIIYSPQYEIDIGSHIFPTSKYRLIKEYLIKKYKLCEENFIAPLPALPETVMKIHTSKYVSDIKNKTLSYADELRLELPYSSELAKVAFLCCGGTLLACKEAMNNGVGVHLGGGFHHAYPDHGEGFCVFNDVALGALEMAEKGRKVLVIDCDLHQGNGTAVCLKNNSEIFTFSIHQENNYPIYKEKSAMDIELEDEIGGDKYNDLLKSALKKIKENFNPDFIIYVAGADTYVDDQLGGISLTIEDLKKRDEIIKNEFNRVPTVITLAGGYAVQIKDTVQIHSNTVEKFTRKI